MGSRRFDIFWERHFGFGFRWEINREWPLHLSIAFPFFTVTIGIGNNLRSAASAGRGDAKGETE